MTANVTKNSPPKALMLLSTHCAHCPSVMESLTKLIKKGALSSLELINLEHSPEIAEQLGVKTVPWIRIGWFELEGLHILTELQQYIEMASSDEGAIEYISELLIQGKVANVLSLVDEHHEIMRYLFALLIDGDEKINIKLGIGVVIEEYAARDWFQEYVPLLVDMIMHTDPRVRADVCHYLSLTENREVLPVITALLNDENDDVKEVARDSVEAFAEIE